MPKTHRDFLYVIFERLVGPAHSTDMKLSFEQQFLPMFPKNKKLDEVIPDEEFARMVAESEKETPAFARFLLSNKFPSLPPDFGSRN